MMSLNQQPTIRITFLPGSPPEVCPELLTTEEAVRYLRLDVDGPKRPDVMLRYYGERGQLKSARVGKRIRYRREDLDAFLAALAN